LGVIYGRGYMYSGVPWNSSGKPRRLAIRGVEGALSDGGERKRSARERVFWFVLALEDGGITERERVTE